MFCFELPESVCVCVSDREIKSEIDREEREREERERERGETLGRRSSSERLKYLFSFFPRTESGLLQRPSFYVLRDSGEQILLFDDFQMKLCCCCSSRCLRCGCCIEKPNFTQSLSCHVSTKDA